MFLLTRPSSKFAVARGPFRQFMDVFVLIYSCVRSIPKVQPVVSNTY